MSWLRVLNKDYFYDTFKPKTMECISVFDMLKVSIGPSSSHTLGPWRACEQYLGELCSNHSLYHIKSIRVHLYGSLSLTGKGHATDKAVMLGLSGKDPETISSQELQQTLDFISKNKRIVICGIREIDFNPKVQIDFKNKFLNYHPNGIRFISLLESGEEFVKTYYSIGGGFIIEKGEKKTVEVEQFKTVFPFPIQTGGDLLKHCKNNQMSVDEVVWNNELTLRSADQIDHKLQQVWDTMLGAMYEGCHTEGILPGGLNVKRRAFDLHSKLIAEHPYYNPQQWIESIRKTEVKFKEILKWVSCFALSVNEVNAAMGRVVTAPTNGSAGVIPAVLMYYIVIENHKASFNKIKKFLLVAGEIGSIFKKGATISAALGGCQAEIGVSSAMAAAGLTAVIGGSPKQILTSAEIAMEHHLGLTCDPVGGLVQIPCIERNSMGAIKAISASTLALETDVDSIKVTLDKVVSTMWATSKDMNTNYKETSTGGLAVSVGFSDC